MSAFSMQRGLFPRLILQRSLWTTENKPARRLASYARHLISAYSTRSTTMSYSVIERGHPNTLDYRIFFRGPNGTPVSPFHDIPLYANSEKTVFNMVVEIPRWTNAKMEISKEEKLNPIKQDVKKGQLRYVKNIFPHHGYIWNYGALPQTWEDPKVKFHETETSGDNDPIDVCEIGHKIHKRGAVIQVKILGTLLLIDEGETDWKIIAIDVTDPLASKINDIDDVHREMPGFLRASYEWFRYYKKPDGKGENTVHWNGECQNREYALQIVKETHNHWQKLMNKPSDSIACVNSNVGGSADHITADAADNIVKQSPEPGPAASVDQDVNLWYYVIPH